MEGRVSLNVEQLFKLDGKKILVTGGGRGIGQMIAEGFVANGAHVIVSSRNEKACEETAKELSQMGPGTCIAIPANLETEKGCQELAHKIAQHTPQLHVLINNSGIAWGSPLEQTTVKSWRKVMDVNVTAPFALIVALLPLLDKAATPEDPARIINIGSVAGMNPQPFPTFAYDTSKAALHHLTRKLSNWLARRGPSLQHSITVNAIAPGYVPTKMSRGLAVYEGQQSFEKTQPLPRAGNKSDMAGAAIFLASPAASWITGIVLPVDGGYSSCPTSYAVQSKL